MANNALGFIKRWYCNKCDNRILPYDGYENLTEVEKGKVIDGQPRAILLHSFNSKIREKARVEGKNYSAMGWCWVCAAWRNGYQLTQMDLVKRYLVRDGIRIRTQSKGLKAAIEEIIQRAS